MLKVILLFFLIYSCSSNLIDYANFEPQYTLNSKFKYIGLKKFSNSDTLYIILQDKDSNRYLIEQSLNEENEVLDTLRIGDKIDLNIKLKHHKSIRNGEKTILLFSEKKYSYIYYLYISDDISKYSFEYK